MHFVEQKFKLYRNETESKMENPTHSFRETNLMLQLIQESQIKSKTVMSWSSRMKKRAFFVSLILSEGNFLADERFECV